LRQRTAEERGQDRRRRVDVAMMMMMMMMMMVAVVRVSHIPDKPCDFGRHREKRSDEAIKSE
jgi:hypothetical protein